MVTTFYPPYNFGGCGTYVRALSRALVVQGHAVEVIHCLDAYRIKSKHSMPDEGSDEGIVVHQLESPFGFLSPLITQLTGRPRNQVTSYARHFHSVVRCRALSQHFARRWSRCHDPEQGASELVHTT